MYMEMIFAGRIQVGIELAHDMEYCFRVFAMHLRNSLVMQLETRTFASRNQRDEVDRFSELTGVCQIPS